MKPGQPQPVVLLVEDEPAQREVRKRSIQRLLTAFKR